MKFSKHLLAIIFLLAAAQIHAASIANGGAENSVDTRTFGPLKPVFAIARAKISLITSVSDTFGDLADDLDLWDRQGNKNPITPPQITSPFIMPPPSAPKVPMMPGAPMIYPMSTPPMVIQQPKLPYMVQQPPVMVPQMMPPRNPQPIITMPPVMAHQPVVRPPMLQQQPIVRPPMMTPPTVISAPALPIGGAQNQIPQPFVRPPSVPQLRQSPQPQMVHIRM